jgi:hypothetical protein
MVQSGRGMMDWRRARKTLVISGRVRRLFELIAVAVACSFFFYLAPKEIWHTEPATGGDTGSHFWPLVTLVKQGLPHWHIKTWNPGNLAGEPHLVHYFPLPYLVMALLSLFVPLGEAFNIGTWLPIALFPLCVYVGLKGLKVKFPIPLLGMVASLCYFYNESYSMWGGNAVSTMAGQFAHVYSFDFFMLCLGAMSYELDKKSFPWWGTLCASGVMLSHFYTALALPFVYIGFFIGTRGMPWKERFRKLSLSALMANVLAAWFVIPMLDNSRWTTPFGLKWGGDQLLHEIAPEVFWPFAALLIFSAVAYAVLTLRRRPLYEREWVPSLLIFLMILVVSGIFYFIFPPLGLVDVRAVPMAQLIFCLLAVFYFGMLLRRWLDSLSLTYVSVGLVALGMWWAYSQVHNFPGWMSWNYSSWSAKPAYKDLQDLSHVLKGDFSDPRVVYENNEAYNNAGTMRVFEMLPYFSGRSTLESVYMQATIVAPEVFYIQALVSQSPSCPFPNYPCTSVDLEKALSRLRLFNVSQLILSTTSVLEKARAVPELKPHGQYGSWYLYDLVFKDSAASVGYVNFIDRPVRWISINDFKSEFYQWFTTDDFDREWLLADPQRADTEPTLDHSVFQVPPSCRPTVQAHFDEIQLHTECPGIFHVLKFAYHSSWRASNGEKIYLVSPGFMGLVPKGKDVTLSFGFSILWNLASLLSWLGLIIFLSFWLASILRRRKKAA